MAGKILDLYPEFGTTSRLDELRNSQYGYLDEQGHVYLDYAGSGLPSRAQLDAQHKRLTSGTFGNPHSCSPTSRLSSDLIDKARERILRFFNAPSDEYAVIFTANASGAVRLVGESYPFERSSRLVMTADNHNSVNGLRQFARTRHARTVYIPMTQQLSIDQSALSAALPMRKEGCFFRSSGPSLFAYPAQSNFTGACHSLTWIELAQQRGYDVLLDAAAYVPTHRLDLCKVQPEFVIISWYKLFGLPTGVGSLIVKKSALARLSRPWFSGGTVNAVTTGVLWHAMANDEAAFEDGTLNFLSIPDVCHGIDYISEIGLELIGTRVRCLTGWLLDRLQGLRHSNGSPMIRIYGPTSTRDRGGAVAFNFLDINSEVVDCRIVGQESAAVGISLRNGCFCNPGAGEAALGLSKRILNHLPETSRGGSMDDLLSLPGLPIVLGAVRVSLGIASTVADIDAFIRFAEESFTDRACGVENLKPREVIC